MGLSGVGGVEERGRSRGGWLLLRQHQPWRRLSTTANPCAHPTAAAAGAAAGAGVGAATAGGAGVATGALERSTRDDMASAFGSLLPLRSLFRGKKRPNGGLWGQPFSGRKGA